MTATCIKVTIYKSDINFKKIQSGNTKCPFDVFFSSESSVSLTISCSSLLTSSSAQPRCIRVEHHCAPSRAATGAARSEGPKTSQPGAAASFPSFLGSYGCEIKAGGRRSVCLRLSELLPDSGPSGPSPARIHKMADMIELGHTYGETRSAASPITIFFYRNALRRACIHVKIWLTMTTMKYSKNLDPATYALVFEASCRKCRYFLVMCSGGAGLWFSVRSVVIVYRQVERITAIVLFILS